MNEPEVVIILATIASVTTLGFAFLRALGRYWERKAKGAGEPGAAVLEDRLARLEREVAALQDGDDRLAELEERLDFAERMLARQTARQLPGAE